MGGGWGLHSGDVFTRESIGGVRDQKTGLPDGTRVVSTGAAFGLPITHYDTLDGLHIWS